MAVKVRELPGESEEPWLSKSIPAALAMGVLVLSTFWPSGSRMSRPNQRAGMSTEPVLVTCAEIVTVSPTCADVGVGVCE